jgi:GNAT superfamily N-acetyltransferase
MSDNGLEFRRTAEIDLRAQYDLFVAAQGELWHRHGLGWSAAPFEAWRAPHRHLLAADGERSFVALDGERLAGFSAALVRGDTWFLSALFVSPDYQGRGVGRDLLDRSWAGDHWRRITITDSIQPVSTTMYARRGLIPTTPILTLSGRRGASCPMDWRRCRRNRRHSRRWIVVPMASTVPPIIGSGSNEQPRRGSGCSQGNRSPTPMSTATA